METLTVRDFTVASPLQILRHAVRVDRYAAGHMYPMISPVTRPYTNPSKVCLITVLVDRLYQIQFCHSASV
jgi:hypothetical protein